MGKSRNKHDSLNTTMSLGDHLEELRARLILAILGLIIGTIICLFFGTRIITFIESPYNKLMPEHPLVVLAPADAFIGYMKISLISGLIVSSPWVFYQLWMFVAAGLYPHERKYVHLAVPFSAILFVAGALFFLFVVAPISLLFFLKFGDFIKVEANWTFQKYISFMTILMLVFGVGFQTPIAIFFLNRTGLVSLQALRKSRKYVLLSVFVIAAVATPPDVISQITLAIPLYALFELGIFLGYIIGRKRKAE
ncbi:MAG: twin-arginine translocase subunit TatC [Planctomycetota bacterium]|jgi:sec-independent protein translocase protein TatC